MLPLITIGDIHLYTYPLVIGLALSLFYTLADFHHDQEGKPLKSFSIFWLGLVITSFICAKLLFYLTYQKEIALLDFFLSGGGLVFYGGILGGLFYLFSYGKLFGKKLEDFKFLVPALCFSHAIGRIGCFLAGCCYGKACHLAWAVEGRHPVQLYEAFFLFLFGIIFLQKKWRSFKTYLFAYAGLRFILEFFRGDEVRGLWFGFSTSQLIALAIILSLLLNRKFRA